MQLLLVPLPGHSIILPWAAQCDLPLGAHHMWRANRGRGRAIVVHSLWPITFTLVGCRILEAETILSTPSGARPTPWRPGTARHRGLQGWGAPPPPPIYPSPTFTGPPPSPPHRARVALALGRAAKWP